MATTGWRQSYFRYQRYFLNVYNLYKKRKDVKMFLEILLSLSAIAIFGVFALRPTFLTIAQLLRQIQEKEDIIIQMDQKIANLSAAQRLFIQEATSIALLNEAVPNQANPDSFVRQIEAAVNRTNVSVIGMSISEVSLVGEPEIKKVKDTGDFPTEASQMSVSVSMSGSYQPLTSFLSDLENLLRPLLIDSVSLNAIATDEGQKLVLLIAGRVPFIANNK